MTVRTKREEGRWPWDEIVSSHVHPSEVTLCGGQVWHCTGADMERVRVRVLSLCIAGQRLNEHCAERSDSYLP
jgi:hypothetical protein